MSELKGTWIRADVDFGLPGINYVLNARSELGQKFLRGLPKEGALTCDVVAYVRDFIGGCRPELDFERLTVFAMCFQVPFGRWQFMVLHPSLPKVGMAEHWPEERLERCPECSRPLSKRDWLRACLSDSLRHEVVCSQQCLVHQERLTSDPVSYVD